MTQFLEGLSASRLLERERIEEVLRRPESPQGDIDGISRFLESSGWLTRFQIDEIRQGRAERLHFAGYRLLDRLPWRPGGNEFRAYHPALQQPVVVRLIDPGSIGVGDNLRSYVERARSASTVSHPNLVNVLDAGFAGEQPFVVTEYLDAAVLGNLVAEMGALPVPLAVEYFRQAATALQAAHAKGLVHGEVTPSRIWLSPIIRKPASNGTGQMVVRPAPGATVRLEGLGQVARRPPLGEVSTPDRQLAAVAPYLPPERLRGGPPDARGDLYSLGATLYFLLAARPPFSGSTHVDTLEQARKASPARVDSLRRDIAASLADLVLRMLSPDPAARPDSAGSVLQSLRSAGGGAPTSPPVEAVPVAAGTDTRPNSLPGVMAAVNALPIADDHSPLVESLPAGTRDSQVYSPVLGDATRHDDHNEWADHGHHDDEPRRPLKKKAEPAKGGWWLLVVGLILHVTAITTAILYAFDLGPFAKEPKAPVEFKAEKNKKK